MGACVTSRKLLGLSVHLLSRWCNWSMMEALQDLRCTWQLWDIHRQGVQHLCLDRSRGTLVPFTSEGRKGRHMSAPPHPRPHILACIQSFDSRKVCVPRPEGGWCCLFQAGQGWFCSLEQGRTRSLQLISALHSLLGWDAMLGELPFQCPYVFSGPGVEKGSWKMGTEST